MIPLVAPCYVDDMMDMLDDDDWVGEFEADFAKRVGCQYAVAVNSGTSALMLALRVLGFTRQHVRIPTYSCVSLLHAVHAVGGIPEFVDSTFDVRGGKAHQHAADVLVHLFGDVTSIPVPLCVPIEDVTLSLGADDTNLLARIGVCSTHRSKMISTDRGGVVFTDDHLLADRVRRMAYYEDFPYNAALQFSLGMSSMQAALGVSQLRQLDSFIARRRELATFYSSRFTEAEIECPVPDYGVFFRYMIAVQDPARTVAKLARVGIEVGRGVYPPLHRLAGLPDDDFPGATAAVNSLLSVPCHPSITDEQAKFVADQVVAVCRP